MNKKEIYEHLANIYLDASLKSSKKRFGLSSYPKKPRMVFAAGLALILGIAAFTVYLRLKPSDNPHRIALFLFQGAAKINFNFDPASKEVLALNLKQLDLSKYRSLGFSVRKTNSKDIISLRIEFTNRFNEKSEIYIKDISEKWTDHRIDFERFIRMKHWTQMKELSFSVEEWNTREKSGIVFLDNIRVLK
ncbi:MAG: hypothetical protein PHQ84_06085 [Candidatus Omnitrophica bacterium]|nr:hypothetical protein [Candidatus Omnitrophota bacterium]MDD5725702.1 hypothetical protein [Candidatus Omnitrophota bacterium]